MRVVAGGKRFVVFQRNMNCMNEGIGKTEEEASEENNNIIPNRKILTGNENMEKNAKTWQLRYSAYLYLLDKRISHRVNCLFC